MNQSIEDHFILVSGINKNNKEPKPEIYPIIKNGELINESLNLYQPVKGKQFYIDIVKAKKIFKRFRVGNNQGEVNNPTLVTFKINKGLEVQIDGQYEELSENLTIFQYTSKIINVMSPVNIIFLFDATMMEYYAFFDEKKELKLEINEHDPDRKIPLGRIEEQLDLFKSSLDCIEQILIKIGSGRHEQVVTHLIDGNEILEVTMKQAGSEIAEGSFGLILFGEYDEKKHPINNFDVENEPKFDILGLPNIAKRIRTGSFGVYDNSLETADRVAEAVRLIRNNITIFKVDGGDYEDCLEFALMRANQLLKRDATNIIVIFTDSPPHPHKDNQQDDHLYQYTSDHYYIYELFGDEPNWLSELQKAEQMKTSIVLLYLPPPPDMFKHLEKERTMTEKIWNRFDMAGKKISLLLENGKVDIENLVEKVSNIINEKVCAVGADLQFDKSIEYPFDMPRKPGGLIPSIDRS